MKDKENNVIMFSSQPFKGGIKSTPEDEANFSEFLEQDITDIAYQKESLKRYGVSVIRKK